MDTGAAAITNPPSLRGMAHTGCAIGELKLSAPRAAKRGSSLPSSWNAATRPCAVRLERVVTQVLCSVPRRRKSVDRAITSPTKIPDGETLRMAAVKFDRKEGTGEPELVSAEMDIPQHPMFPPAVRAKTSPSGSTQTRVIPESSPYTGMGARPPEPNSVTTPPPAFSSPTHSLTQQPPPWLPPSTMSPDGVRAMADTLPGQGSTVQPPDPNVGSRRPRASRRATSHPLAVLPARMMSSPGAGRAAAMLKT